MAKRPTIADLAEKAGVSVATVDRVLNGRLPVREETARRVYDAAREIGYHATGLIRQRIEREVAQYRLGFLLQRPEQEFYQNFAAAIRAACTEEMRFRTLPAVEFLDSQNPADNAARLKDLAQRCRAVAMTSIDHPTVSAAVAEVKARGVPVFSLLSDFASGVREGYVGLNNRKVGRSAAWIISRIAKPGKIAIFVGSGRFHGHELREIGFRSYFREYAPQFQLLDTLLNLETPSIAYEATLHLMQRHGDLAGFYVAGGGMEGAIAALREEGAGRGIIAVCNELTAESRSGLADNVITAAIATPLVRLSQQLLGLMVTAIESGPADTPGQFFLPYELFISENI